MSKDENSFNMSRVRVRQIRVRKRYDVQRENALRRARRYQLEPSAYSPLSRLDDLSLPTKDRTLSLTSVNESQAWSQFLICVGDLAAIEVKDLLEEEQLPFWIQRHNAMMLRMHVLRIRLPLAMKFIWENTFLATARQQMDFSMTSNMVSLRSKNALPHPRVTCFGASDRAAHPQRADARCVYVAPRLEVVVCASTPRNLLTYS
jgi:hypothetical protein